MFNILNFEGTSVSMGSLPAEVGYFHVGRSSTDHQGPMPMGIDRVQDTKEKGKKVRKARMTIKRAKVKMPRANERKDKEIRKERKVITRAKEKERPERQRCGNIVHLWKARTYC